jgi:hypothetical protein
MAKDNEAIVAAAGKVAVYTILSFSDCDCSHHAKTGDNLLPDRLHFSFQKGFNGIKLYHDPVRPAASAAAAALLWTQ